MTRQSMAEKLAVANYPFVYLMIRQTPNRPVWALAPSTPIRWEAVSVLDTTTEINTPTALVFSSLPKAVAFMQPAVIANVLVGVTRIAKFERRVAAQWAFPTLLNPVFEALHRAEYYTLPGPWLPIDPKSAITGDE